ncbi:unnamed protein product [Linum tenue]|uniref:Uncharacterized protein n=1 Tax=Linum tenue TaxID=586396 RepID=A0AAV0H9E0_9ROSI|nr:unnamed protein product [Linum tenue]
MPKPICSPARGSEPNKQRGHHHRTPSAGGSPMLWGKTKQQMGSGDNLVSEPTSPKVTCAGQIKVRHHHHKASANCKNWQSVMEEIERLHNHRKQQSNRSSASTTTTTSSWAESLGFKNCLRSIRFDLRCFGSFPQSDINSDDDDEDEEDDENEGEDEMVVEDDAIDGNEWFMVLQENKGNDCEDGGEKEKEEEAAVPPANALLLMRCRSAPRGKNLKTLMEEERKTEMEKLIVMRYDTDFYKISCDVAKETWVVGGGMMNMTDPFSRSRSWKR